MKLFGFAASVITVLAAIVLTLLLCRRRNARAVHPSDKEQTK